MLRLTSVFPTALLVCSVSLGLIAVYQSEQTTSEFIDMGLQTVINRLAELQLRIRRQLSQLTESSIGNEDSHDADVTNNYDLSDYEHQCPRHRYTTRIIDRKPLIIYVEQFLTRDEIAHLIGLAEPLFNSSKIYDANGVHKTDAYRSSTSAYIKRQQTPVVKCIEQRFAQFQGDIDVERLERLQVVKYAPSQQFLPHHDWFSQPALLKNGGQRVTSFFTYLQANCSKGETEFVEVPFDKQLHERFCDILTCDEQSSKAGIRFRPIPGNSVFWSNVDSRGHPDPLTLHAGRSPGKNGYKIGMNTWTRERVYTDVAEK